MQEAPAVERLHIRGTEPERTSDRGGMIGDPVTMALGATVAVLDHHRQGGDDRRGRIEVVRVALQPDQGRDAREELLGVDRFGQEIVRAGLPAFDSTLAIAQPGYSTDMPSSSE